MSGSKEHNGWSSYETWQVNLHIENDENNYWHSRELARQAWADSEDIDPHDMTPKSIGRCGRATYDLSQMLKEWIEEAVSPDDSPYRLANDLLTSALSEVNWVEIAEHYIEEVSEE